MDKKAFLPGLLATKFIEPEWGLPVAYCAAVLLRAYHTPIFVALAGDTMKEAVDEANRMYMPRHMEMTDTQAIPNPMKIVGDPHTRLVNVYASLDERSQFPNWRTSWYLTLP